MSSANHCYSLRSNADVAIAGRSGRAAGAPAAGPGAFPWDDAIILTIVHPSAVSRARGLFRRAVSRGGFPAFSESQIAILAGTIGVLVAIPRTIRLGIRRKLAGKASGVITGVLVNPALDRRYSPDIGLGSHIIKLISGYSTQRDGTLVSGGGCRAAPCRFIGTEWVSRTPDDRIPI